MSFTDTCIQRPVLAWMLMLATLIFGVIGYARIGISQMPDVDIPYVTVQFLWTGAAPEMIEHDVIEPVEEALAQIEGLKSLTSTSRQGSGTVQLELRVGRDIDAAVQDVQNKLGQVQFLLPADVEPPVVQKANFEEMPILWISLSGRTGRCGALSGAPQAAGGARRGRDPMGRLPRTQRAHLVGPRPPRWLWPDRQRSRGGDPP